VKAGLLLCLLAAALIVGGMAVRESRSQSQSDSAARFSTKRSGCGRDAGLRPSELRPPRIRALIICLHNEERARRGLPVLEQETRLETAAQRHAEDMVAREFFAHETPEGLGPAERALSAGYPAKHYSSGENLAWGTGLEASPVEIIDGWMQSPGHRENILRNAFTQIGVGVVPAVPEKPEDPLPGATYAVSFGGPPLPVEAP
jgi:uncharacterized protein YkwD